MDYEIEPIKKKPSTRAVRNSRNAEIDHMLQTHGDGRVLWRMAVEHKFGLMTAYATVMTILVVAPFLPGLLAHM